MLFEWSRASKDQAESQSNHEGLLWLLSLPAQLRDLLLYVNAHQAGEIAAENLLFGLRGKLRHSVAVGETP